jgi:hypothetical protein
MKVDVHRVEINFTNLDINNIIIDEDILDYANLIKLYTHFNKGNKHGRPKIFSTSQKTSKFHWIVVVDEASMAILTTRVINLNWTLLKCSNMLNQLGFHIFNYFKSLCFHDNIKIRKLKGRLVGF